MLATLNVFFFVFHTALIVFNVAGWAWRRTRLLNLATLLLTAVSWLVMGIWNGIGYCICTDWHWQVRAAMGIHDSAGSYVQFLIQRMLGLDPPVVVVNVLCGVVFGLSFAMSVGTNWRARLHRVGC